MGERLTLNSLRETPLRWANPRRTSETTTTGKKTKKDNKGMINTAVRSRTSFGLVPMKRPIAANAVDAIARCFERRSNERWKGRGPRIFPAPCITIVHFSPTFLIYY